METPENRYPKPPHWRAFHQDLLARVRALPGVQSAAVVMLRPLWGTTGMDWRFVVQGQSEEEASRNPTVVMETVSADYFRTMGIHVQRGRVFTDADVEGQPGVVVLGATMARRYWPGQDPVGKQIKIPLPDTPYDNQWLTVVGVVDDVRYREIQKTRLDLYMSYLQANHRIMHVVVRAKGDPLAVAPAVRAAVRAVDPGLPVDDVVPMTRVVEEALGGPRFAARLFTAFALVAGLLAALGLYGLLAYSVTRRTREIGVRVALGARPLDVSRLVLREGMMLALGGIAIGVAVAAASARALRSLLYGVPPLDPITFASAPILLAAVAAAACLLPVRRARRVDPVEALRSE